MKAPLLLLTVYGECKANYILTRYNIEIGNSILYHWVQMRI